MPSKQKKTSGFRVSRFDPLSCEDIDECQHRNGGCSHLCKNTDGGHECHCLPDHLLQPDGRTCLPGKELIELLDVII